VTAFRARPIVAALLALAAAAALSACGNRHDVKTHGETEGAYLDVGPLQYQVQMSRQLNPKDTEDKAYFVGVPDPEGQVNPQETWFAVFVKVWNRTERTHRAAPHFEVEDTEGTHYEPIEVEPANVFAYRPGLIPPSGTLPPRDSIANQSPIGGAMLLYKLPLDALANRPLDLVIRSEKPEREASVQLDV
jgi:hypothetical protein